MLTEPDGATHTDGHHKQQVEPPVPTRSRGFPCSKEFIFLYKLTQHSAISMFTQQ